FANQNVAGSNPQNVGELADLLERAIKSVVYEGKLIWDVKPKTLVGPNNPAKQISAAESEEQFGKWQKDAEAKAKHDKEQAAAEKRVAALIAAFTPTKNGRLDYPLIEKVNARHRGWFEDAKKDGKDLLKVEEQIRRDQQVTYDRVERLKEAFQRRWQEFVRLNPDKILGAPASDPELDAVTNPDPTPVAPVKPVVTKQTLNKMDRDIKDLEEAQVRFRYWQSQGLLN